MWFSPSREYQRDSPKWQIGKHSGDVCHRVENLWLCEDIPPRLNIKELNRILALLGWCFWPISLTYLPQVEDLNVVVQSLRSNNGEMIENSDFW